MSDPKTPPQATNDPTLPYRVMVERVGPHTKGVKMYSGAASKKDAEALAERENNREAKKPPGEQRYTYTVEKAKP